MSEEINGPLGLPTYKELTASITELETEKAMLVDALEQLLVDDNFTIGEEEYEHIKQTLSATSADTEAWLQAEIVKRLGEPVGYFDVYNGDSYIQIKAKFADVYIFSACAEIKP